MWILLPFFLLSYIFITAIFFYKIKQPVQPEPRRIRHSIIRGRLAFEHPAYSLDNRTQPHRIPHFYIDLNNNPSTY